MWGTLRSKIFPLLAGWVGQFLVAEIPPPTREPRRLIISDTRRCLRSELQTQGCRAPTTPAKTMPRNYCHSPSLPQASRHPSSHPSFLSLLLDIPPLVILNDIGSQDVADVASAQSILRMGRHLHRSGTRSPLIARSARAYLA